MSNRTLIQKEVLIFLFWYSVETEIYFSDGIKNLSPFVSTSWFWLKSFFLDGYCWMLFQYEEVIARCYQCVTCWRSINWHVAFSMNSELTACRISTISLTSKWPELMKLVMYWLWACQHYIVAVYIGIRNTSFLRISKAINSHTDKQ